MTRQMRFLKLLVLLSITFAYFQHQSLSIMIMGADSSNSVGVTMQRRIDALASTGILNTTDFSVNFTSVFDDRVFVDNSSVSGPPIEDTWLLSPGDVLLRNHSIPRRINKIYFQKDGEFLTNQETSASLREAHRSWQALNPGYHVRYFNLINARKYLKTYFNPIFLSTFDCIQAFAGKSDFFRVALLYREGGFHSDWKQECLEFKLLERISNETNFFVALDIGNAFTFKSKSCAANSFIGSVPRHPILAKYLHLVMKNVRNSLYPVNVLFTTGPCVLGIAVRYYNKDFGSDENINHQAGYYFWNGKKIVRSKCDSCGEGQSWGDLGNNYYEKYNSKTYYCEDSLAIFRDTNDYKQYSSSDQTLSRKAEARAVKKTRQEKPSAVQLEYIDVLRRDGPVYRTAVDEKGILGYLHDETFLARSPPEFAFKDASDKEVLCKKGDPDYTMLTDKVFVDLASHEAAEKRAKLGNSNRTKIFCVVYTIENNHDRITTITETWAKKCDGFMAASTKTDVALGTVLIPHEGPEEYDNMWQKVRSIWSYVYDHYYEKYDYFHIGGDDLYLIVENLRLYLESKEIQQASNEGPFLSDELPTASSADSQTPLFLGRRFAENGNRDRMFNSGGSGYTINKATLKTLVVDALPNCLVHTKTAAEDTSLATCLKKFGILPYDTKDEAGGERYMIYPPGQHLTYIPPKKNPKLDWYFKYSVDTKWGIDHCAAKSVAFHYINKDLMRRMHAILYHYCWDAAPNKQLMALPAVKKCTCVDCNNDKLCGGLWLGKFPDAPSEEEVLHMKLRIVVSHCKASLDWMPTYLQEFTNVASIHVISKCGMVVEKAPYSATTVVIPNVGREGHAYAYYITDILPKLVTGTTDNSIVLFLKDTTMGKVHQGNGLRRADLKSLIQIASSANGFACGLVYDQGSKMSAYHDVKTLHQLRIKSYGKGNRDYDTGDVVPFLSPTYNTFGDFYGALNATSNSDLVQVCYGGTFVASTERIFEQDMNVWRKLKEALERGDNIQEGHFAERSWGPLLATPLKTFQIEALRNHSTDVMFEHFGMHGSLLRKGPPRRKRHTSRLRSLSTINTIYQNAFPANPSNISTYKDLLSLVNFDIPVPQNLRIVFMGDSLTRYQYLDMAYFLSHNGTWISPDDIPNMVNEKTHPNWNSFFKFTNIQLNIGSSSESCDCYRTEGVVGAMKQLENRYFNDSKGNSVSFLQKAGHLPFRTSWDAFNIHDNHTRLFLTKETNISIAEEGNWTKAVEFVCAMNPKPKALVFNSGFWLDKELSEEKVQVELIQKLRVCGIISVYKTTTATSSGRILRPDNNRARLCSLADLCLDVKWTRLVRDAPDTKYWDDVHFNPPIYSLLNIHLLAVLASSDLGVDFFV